MADDVTQPTPLDSKISRWTVAQIGAREHFGIARGFHQSGMLRGVHTDMWCRAGGSLLKRGPAQARAFAARHHPEIPSRLVYSHNFAAIRRMLLSKKPNTRADEFYEHIRIGKWFADAVEKDLHGCPMEPGVDRFFGYNTGCLEVLPLLKDRGVFTVVDQIDPARTEERLVLEEMQRWPGWQPMPETIPSQYFDRLQAEWELADIVVVNSDWSRRALIDQGVPDDKIVVVPLAVAPVVPPIDAANRSNGGTITVLWLGSVILRKGIQYLIEAAKRLHDEDIRFVVAGPIGISAEAVALAPSNMEFVGRVTRDRSQSYFQAADIFVLPTISDGFALTQLEAMAHGLPVITTPNCGEVVEEGLNGYIVPARDTEQLADRILRLAHDRDLREAMRLNALRRVADFPLSWPAFMIESAAQRFLAHANR